MHPHHQLALDKARSNFRQARVVMNACIKSLRLSREFIVVRDKVDHYHISYIKQQQAIVLSAIKDYQAAGEVLVIVERMLRNA